MREHAAASELAPRGGRNASGVGFAAYPDARSFRRKFGLIAPATNTSMEHELWSVVFRNHSAAALAGVGLHSSNVVTPDPRVGSAATLAAYRAQFLGALHAALDAAALAEPQRLIIGMSLEHILRGIHEIERTMRDAEAHARVACSTSHAAFAAALRSVGARRIGLLTPFDETGTANARRMFEDLGFEVVASVGLACANAVQIAHVPDWAKERAIQESLALPENRLDAIVQSGTNMSLLDVTERLEPVLGIPILGVNAVLFWHALRESGIAASLLGAGRLLREH